MFGNCGSVSLLTSLYGVLTEGFGVSVVRLLALLATSYSLSVYELKSTPPMHSGMKMGHELQ